MVSSIYKKTFSVLMKRPFRLWGIALLAGALDYLLKPISKAIQTSDIGINPIDDGQVIRLVFPAPTEERRKQLTKDVKKQGEDAKTAVRNIRRDAMDKFKAMKKAGEITEDDQKKLEEETQKLTDKYVKMIDDTCADKNKEIMEV
mgnify:CR=1 FL=1